MNVSAESDDEFKIQNKYLLQHVVDIEPSYLSQFDRIESRLTVDRDQGSYSHYKKHLVKESYGANSEVYTQLKKDAQAVGKELLLQHNLRAADIIRANRDKALTYWAGQQMWLHDLEGTAQLENDASAPLRGAGVISSPEVSFVMNAAVRRHGPGAQWYSTSRNFDEKRRMGVVHVNRKASLIQQHLRQQQRQLLYLENQKDYKDSEDNVVVDGKATGGADMGDALFDNGDDKYTVTKFTCPRFVSAPTVPRKKGSRGSVLSSKPKKNSYKSGVVRMKTDHMVNISRLGVMDMGRAEWMAPMWHIISTNDVSSIWDIPRRGDSEVVSSDGGGDMENMKDKVAQRSDELPTVFIPLVVPIPRYLAWCRLTQNYWADEDPVLRYVPYFGDDDITGFDTSYYDYVPGELEGELGGEVLETAITMLTDMCSPDPQNGRSDLDLPIADEDIEPLPSTLEMCLMSAFSLSVTQVRQAVKKGRQHVGRPRRELPATTFNKLQNALGTQHMVPLVAPSVLASFPPHVEEQYHANTGLRKSKVYSDVAANFVDLFCRRCYKFDCKTHAIKQPLPNERQDPLSPPVGCGVSEITYKRPLVRIIGRGTDTSAGTLKRRRLGRCQSDYAFYSEVVRQDMPFNMYESSPPLRTSKKAAHANVGKSGKKPLSTGPVVLIRRPCPRNVPAECAIALKLRDIMLSSSEELFGGVKANETAGPSLSTVAGSSSVVSQESVDVTVAALLGTCLPSDVSEMYVLAENDAMEAGGHISMEVKQESSLPNEASNGESKKVRKKTTDGSSGTIGINKHALHKIRNSAAQSMREAHKPCTHTGPCVYGVCGCIETGYCEVTCACWGSKCCLQFKGCKCRLGQCRTKSCWCFAADRECDPNLCLTCGVAVHPYLRDLNGGGGEPSSSSDGTIAVASSTIPAATADVEARCCSNANMLLGLGKKVSVGRSSIHGWGAFIREAAQKGDFIMEYRGEMVSQNEADRRGKRFDKIDSTFLFNLCEEVCIDATRKGSKAKFANHSFTPNCHSRIKLVRGDFRIGIYATRALRAGEEITFNYGMRVSDEDAPGWCMLLQTSSSQHNTEFLVWDKK